MESSLANAHVHVLVPELEMLIVTEQVTLSLGYRCIPLSVDTASGYSAPMYTKETETNGVTE